MDEFNIDSFLTRFFKQQECNVTILEDGIYEIQLTEEMDRAIMNRPFYWHYVQATGRAGEPQRLILRTNINNSDDRGEWIHFGTPRMNDICNYLEKTSRFIQAFQCLDVKNQTLLHPWFVVNGIISYKGKQIKEEPKSIGLNLINGTIIEHAMEHLKMTSFSQTISPHCFTVTPLIKIRSGFQRIEHYIGRHITQTNNTWAIDSLLLLKDELLLLNHFYKNNSEKEDLKKEVTQLYYRLRPEVNFSIINSGIFYVTANFPRQTLAH